MLTKSCLYTLKTYFRCLHIYECVSHGREYFWTLHLTTDTRYTLQDMQPSSADRIAPYPAWWERGSGSPYPSGGPGDALCTNLSTGNANDSLVIVRDASHPENLSGGSEKYIPSHVLQGVISLSLSPSLSPGSMLNKK